ncbi:MAG: ABC transporter ATP-binding protein/permease [Oscillospiraceae bacterium]|nr:ABC transporter ATP-binding protein/permease [Oscillospiraceae bacterium]
MKKRENRGTLRKLWTYLKPYRVALLILGLCALLCNAGNLLGPMLAGSAIAEAEAGMGQVNFSRVVYYAGWMLGLYVGSNLLSLAVSMGMMRLSRRVAKQLRRDVFDKLSALPVGYFDRNPAGDIISRVSYDVDVVSTSLATDITQMMTSVVTVVGSFIMMCTISLPLTCCMLVTIPISLLYTRYRSRHIRPLYARRSAAYGEMNGFVEEMFSGQKTILAYAYEEEACRRFSRSNRQAADAYNEAEQMGVVMGPTMGFINNLGLALIGLVGALLYAQNIVTLASISSFVLYSRMFSGPINEFANVINEIFSALSAAERVFRFLEEEEETPDAPDAAVLERAEGNVAMEHVRFGYVPERVVLKNLSLRAETGQTVAIVGATGAGKTTIINLLMRFYDVDAVGIYVDGREIRALTRASLRRSYAMVLQDTWVFQGTIFDNIAYGKENASMEEVEAAARAAHIHSYIMSLPQGYQTVLREDGGNISKGQKQLLTIARAMLYDTSMLILDEATSNVDTATERRVQQAMAALMRGKTSFVIAHRLSTIQEADQILVVEQGDVVEQGTHRQLMDKKGKYYQMYASQFE